MSIRRPGPKLLAVTLVVGVFLFAGVIGVRAYTGAREDEQIRQLLQETRRLAREGQEAHAALCVFKQDLQRRVETSTQFLEDNPGGIPGIPASVLKQSIASQRQTLDALKKLDCEGER